MIFRPVERSDLERRILVAEAGATTIHADTDLENRPMAVAFEQAGYRPAGRRLVLSAAD